MARFGRLNSRLHSLILVGALAACIIASCVRLTPRQGWAPTWGPVVPHDTFPSDCSLCHVSEGWDVLRSDFAFDHLKETGVPLVGAHARAACLRCHNDRGPVATFAAKGCAGCHEDVHRGRLGHFCEQCHTSESWRPVNQVAEHNRTGFPLIGKHVALPCVQCHQAAAEGMFDGLNSACISCHLADYEATTEPNHASAGYGTDCTQCHTPVAWRGTGALVHPASFPLSGGHSGLQCAACHRSGTYTGLPTACMSCHVADYQATTSPNHAASGFSTDCASCHSTTQWQGATFNHPFPLTGGHTGLQCTACHTGGTYMGLSSACVSCHLADHQATTNPNHAASGFSTDCTACHTTTQWLGATFTHSAFPLTGGHTGLQCAACHSSGVYTGLPSSCVSCHLADYQATTNPNHAAAGFSTDCTACHSTTTWLGATFTHSAFPLTGGHTGLQCAACHSSGVYTGLPSSCVSCHLADYQATTNPNHAAAGFSTDCTACHTTTQWQGATFNHPFPISGPHAGLRCADCHLNPSAPREFSCTHCHAHEQARMADKHSSVAGYVWTSAACVSCHPDGRH